MLKDCQAGGRFEGTILVTEWKESPFRQKQGTFITLMCQDASGVMSAKIWEPELTYLTWWPEKDVFHIEAAVTEFRGTLELAIEALRPLKEEEIDLTTLLPCSPVPEEDLEKRLQNLLQSVGHPALEALLERILEHPEWGKAYRQAPAALKIHQAYLRGLWEHSVTVAEIARGIASSYPEINGDLLITGALLHDIGKIYEYGYERGITYTTDGRLLGHIVMGVEMLTREISGIRDFPKDLRTKLLHIITSHHGRYEWQSPKRPKCMEAVVIHYADALEAELWQFRRAKEESPAEEWSPYVRSLERYIFLK
ncbi:MAG: 3'-5' exoribonuclease YhaM family protein [Desulfitobacteriaceae bacterium]